MWHSLTPKRHVFESVTSILAHDKFEALLCALFLWKRRVERQYLNYSSSNVQCSEYMEQLTSKEFHLQRIILFQYWQYSLLNFNTGTGKLFKTAHTMQTFHRAYVEPLTGFRKISEFQENLL